MKQGFEKEVLYADVVFVSDPMNFSAREVNNAKKYQFKTNVEGLLKFEVVSIISLNGELNFGIFVGYSKKNPVIKNHALLINKVDVSGTQKQIKAIENAEKEALKGRIVETMKNRMESPFILDLLAQMDLGLKEDFAAYEKLTGKKFTMEDYKKHLSAPF